MSGNGEQLSDSELREIDRQAMDDLGLGQDLSRGDDSDGTERVRTPEQRKKRRRRIALATTALVLAGCVPFACTAANAGGASIKGETSLQAAGTGKVESIDMRVKPITITTIKTGVKGTETEFKIDVDTKANIGFGDIKFSLAPQDLYRDAQATTTVGLDTSHVQIEWVPPKANAKGDAKLGQLYYIMPNAAISQETTVVGSTVDKGAGITAMPQQATSVVAGVIGKMFGGKATEVPLLGLAAKNDISTQAMLEKYSDDVTAVNVGKYCTKAVMELPDYDKDLQENVAYVSRGILLTDPKSLSLLNHGLKNMHDFINSTSDPTDSLVTLVQNGKALLPGQTIAHPDAPTTMKIPDDSADIAELNNYKKTGFLNVVADSAKDAPMKCDASDAKLIENTQSHVAPSSQSTKKSTPAPTSTDTETPAPTQTSGDGN